MRFLALWLCVAACTDDLNAAGNYSVTVTNRDNGCNLANWTAGTTGAATVTLTQSSNNVTAVVTGLGAIALEVAVGGHSFTGKINGATLLLDLFGTRTNNAGNCTYTLNAQIHAVLDGDKLTGQIDYRSATNGNPDCGGITNCDSFQEMAGMRTQP
jgi:hypothetical protein